MTQILGAQGKNTESNKLSMQKQSIKSTLMQARQSILLLNGRSDQRDQISELLNSRLGYNVLDADAGVGQPGDAQFRMLQPDAVIIDVATLPHSRQLVVSLSVQMPDTAIIILVGYGEYQEAQEYLMLGAQDFITKPFSQERISVTLRNALALQGARKEVRDMLSMARMPQGQAAGNAGKNNMAGLGSILPLLNASGELRKLHDIESAVIRFAITYCNGRISTVSRKLGVGRSTLYRKLASLGR